MTAREGKKYDESELFTQLKNHPLYRRALASLPKDRREFMHEYLRSIAENMQTGVLSKLGMAMQAEAEKTTGSIPKEKIIKDN
jgi:hypothetical protein